MPSYCKGEACAEKKKQAHFGIKGSGKPQWCAICAKQHRGVYLGKRQMCEDCQVKHASYGEVGGKVQWCGLCAKEHGAISLQKMCEDCGKKRAHCGLQADQAQQQLLHLTQSFSEQDRR